MVSHGPHASSPVAAVPEGSDSLSHVLFDDGVAPLAVLTARLSDLCRRFSAADARGLLLVARSSVRPWPGRATQQEISRWERELRRLENLPTLIVACCEGRVTGAALDLLLIADYRIATKDALLSVAFNEGAAWPGMALYRLVRQIGYAQARKMILLGEDLPADRAAAIGLVDETADTCEAASAAALHVRRCLDGSELAVRRRLALEACASEYEDALGSHLAACARESGRLGPDAGPRPPCREAGPD